MGNLKKYSLVSEKTDLETVVITSSKDANQFIRNFYHADLDIYESFFILLLNRANRAVGYAKISQGGITGTVVDVKIIAKICLDSLCSNVILAHNHPSGTSRPSDADITITNKIKEALLLIECDVFDHIIITEDSYYSFADEGTL